MSLTMTEEEREAFLDEVHVAIISIPESGRGTLTVPVWYAFIPEGEFHVWTGGNSRKARLLSEAGRFSLCVQQETPPYKYVIFEFFHGYILNLLKNALPKESPQRILRNAKD